MHVLHGSWLPEINSFVLWGEDTSLPIKSSKAKKTNRPSTVPHPFPLAPDHWLHYLDRFAKESQPNGEAISILLPGSGVTVQPSPEAQLAGMSGLDGTLSLLPWTVSAVTLRIAEAFDLLLHLPYEQETGYILGPDLLFWRQVALFAARCLVEQTYLPMIEQRGKQYLATWRPSITPQVMHQFTSAMPPLCRALVSIVEPTIDAAPDPRTLFEHFLNTLVDVQIRTQATWPQSKKKAGVKKPAKATNTGKIGSNTIPGPVPIALLNQTSVITGIQSINDKLFERWKAWHQPIEAMENSAFRVCFRLDEPPANSEGWSLSYMLQAVDDPSLIVDAAVAWGTTGKTLTYLERRFDNPQEKLLMALGAASRIFPPIDRSLRESSPVGVRLTSEEARQFLLEAAPLLEASKYSVLVPNWWKQRASIRARVKIKSTQNEPSGILSRENLASYQWELSVGDQSMSQKEFEQLVSLKQPMIRLHGQWIVLDQSQIDAALRFLDGQNTQGDLNLLEALKLTAETEANGLTIDGVDVEGWLETVFAGLNNPDLAYPPPIPAGLQATLRPYQLRGFAWLAQMYKLGLGACLADDMGLGKTSQTITLLLHKFEQAQMQGLHIPPALVVCPTSVLGNWRHEIHRFGPDLRVYTHQGAGRPQNEQFLDALNDTQANVVLTSFSLLSRDLDTLKLVKWSTIVLDEAQNIKNPTTKQAQAARAVEADQRLALTGTPVENRLTELWSILQFLNPGYLGSLASFREHFSLPIERYNDAQAAKTLKKLTSPFILRRVKTDPKVISDLPEKFENKVFCTLSSEQATLYEAIVREEMELIDEAESGIARRGNILRMLTRLKQICNHPAQFLKEGDNLSVTTLEKRSGKLTRLVEMLEEIYAAGDRALIFTQYAEMGHMLQNYLGESFADKVLFLHGGTPVPKREEMVQQFQAPRGPTVFILSLKAGGTGLNLTRANNVFHFDRWYNPAVENQATDRAFRIGQTRNVQVHKFICLGTLEEKIDELIDKKRGLADKIVGDSEGWLSELSNTELRSLVTLRREVFEE